MDIFLHSHTSIITTNKPNKVEEIFEPRLEEDQVFPHERWKESLGDRNIWCKGLKKMANAQHI